MVEDQASNRGVSGNPARRILLLCLLVVLNTSADMIVDLGAAGEFMLLDISINPLGPAQISKGIFEGDIGWSGGADTTLELKNAVFNADLYRREDSRLRLTGKTNLLGTDYSAADMRGFEAAIDAAVARFGTFTQDIDLGNIDQTGGLTINRTDEYTVVDVSELKLTSGTLTINGEADDIFYIRVRDVFELYNVDIVVNGTHSSRVFFIFDGHEDLEFKNGDFLGNIVAPNASVELTHINSFDGSILSGDGFKVTGAHKETAFKHTEAIPESTVLGLVASVGGAAIFIHRFFRFRGVNSGASHKMPGMESVDSAG